MKRIFQPQLEAERLQVSASVHIRSVNQVRIGWLEMVDVLFEPGKQTATP
eukprot:CAMPEP_0203779768 /NCGR_PEP_ID=MMETSP0099_2-20121227/8918_1 /ASSEMBLY_ACC=CAM_ASM_000209 /TAXON_ID=96639 /ORGANISM=" , Strain NY0313808BC1" /LENGTH=49 /DNA_ID= /DNA_START= /DNA_END= /DNA_ORIENTATION=